MRYWLLRRQSRVYRAAKPELAGKGACTRNHFLRVCDSFTVNTNWIVETLNGCHTVISFFQLNPNWIRTQKIIHTTLDLNAA